VEGTEEVGKKRSKFQLKNNPLSDAASQITGEPKQNKPMEEPTSRQKWGEKRKKGITVQPGRVVGFVCRKRGGGQG